MEERVHVSEHSVRNRYQLLVNCFVSWSIALNPRLLILRHILSWLAMSKSSNEFAPAERYYSIHMIWIDTFKRSNVNKCIIMTKWNHFKTIFCAGRQLKTEQPDTLFFPDVPRSKAPSQYKDRCPCAWFTVITTKRSWDHFFNHYMC